MLLAAAAAAAAAAGPGWGPAAEPPPWRPALPVEWAAGLLSEELLLAPAAEALFLLMVAMACLWE